MALAGAPVGPSPYLDLIPTGAGETRRIPGHGLDYLGARWLPDERIVVSAQQDQGPARLHVLDRAEGEPRALTPAGVRSWAVSPDGRRVAVTGPDSNITLYTVDGGEVHTVPQVEQGAALVGWTEQGLLVTREDASRYSLSAVFQIDPATGRERLWKRIVPADPSGIMYLGNLTVTPDGRSYAYSWHRALSDLYLVDGLK